MKLLPAHSKARRRGVSLIECLVYIAVLAVVTGIAFIGFNRCWDDNKHLRRNADDIIRALHAGEQWRADVRAATGEIRTTIQNEEETVVIPQMGGNVTYRFAQGELQRQATPGASAAMVLDRIQTSHMQAERRQHVTAWRWELTLTPTQKNVRLMPWFTFESAAGHQLP